MDEHVGLSPTRIGVGLDGSLGLSFSEMRDIGMTAAQLGFESLWTTAGGVPDPFHICMTWAEASRSASGSAVRTAIGVLPALRTWLPSSLACQAATVGLVSGGNFVLGIGSGGGARAEHFAAFGFPGRPIAAMRAYVAAVQSVLSGEPGASGVGTSIWAAERVPGAPFAVPLYLAALGPQMLHLAGVLADGISLSWASPAQIAWSAQQVAAGASSAGRDRSQIAISGYVRVCVDDDVELARRALARQFLRYGLPPKASGPSFDVYRAHFARMGFEGAFADLEGARDRGADDDELADRLPEEVLAEVGYYGTAAGAARRYAELSRGLDETVVRIVAARPGRDAIESALEALSPAAVRAAQPRPA